MEAERKALVEKALMYNYQGKLYFDPNRQKFWVYKHLLKLDTFTNNLVLFGILGGLLGLCGFLTASINDSFYYYELGEIIGFIIIALIILVPPILFLSVVATIIKNSEYFYTDKEIDDAIKIYQQSKSELKN